MGEYVMQETYRLNPSFLIPTMNNAHVERMGIFQQGSGSEKHNSAPTSVSMANNELRMRNLKYL